VNENMKVLLAHNWRALALMLHAKICNKCRGTKKKFDYHLCEVCPQAQTIAELSKEKVRV